MQKGFNFDEQDYFKDVPVSAHFFFNVMNATKYLVKEDPDAAQKMIMDVSRYFRYMSSSTSSATGLATFFDEWKAVKSYIDLRKALSSSRLETEYHVDSSYVRIPILSFISATDSMVRTALISDSCSWRLKIVSDSQDGCFLIKMSISPESRRRQIIDEVALEINKRMSIFEEENIMSYSVVTDDDSIGIELSYMKNEAD